MIIKVLKEEHPTLATIARLKQEYEITRRLDLEGVIKVHELIRNNNGYALIKEDIGGTSLKKLIPADGFDLQYFLNSALQLAEIISGIHSQNVIHRDLKPHNIIINQETNQLKITDFGIAWVLPQEEYPVSTGNLEGTLAYIAPEQTGRMSQMVDFRSDLYSLGITFYEMSTGRLPFQSEDPMELVHAHLAKKPPPPETYKSIPQAVSAIIMKLLRKTPEERYNSAPGLKADLHSCLLQLAAGKSITLFPGQIEKAGIFTIPRKIYGRETEISEILKAYKRAVGERSELFLVSGSSGIGKSSLIYETQRHISGGNNYFISGKFEQFKNNIPYAPIIHAFSELVKLLLTKSEEQLEVLRANIKSACGNNARIITDVIPGMELIIGKLPQAPSLPPAEARNRFNLIFRDFLRIFSQMNQTLVIFLDDLHWADNASLNLIELLCTDPDTRSLLIMGAYRDGEIDNSHPMRITLDSILERGGTLNSLRLNPLQASHINMLLSDTLGRDQKEIEPLGEVILRKTAGNPFFVEQFLTSLYHDKMIVYDASGAGAYKWDLGKIERMRHTENVVDLMANKIRGFSPDTQEILKQASCIGIQFDLNTLSMTKEQSPALTAAALWEPMQEGFILPVDDGFQHFPHMSEEELSQVSADKIRVTYRFLHDRVQQAAYSLIPEDEKRQSHVKIGRVLLQNALIPEVEERLFEIVHQLNLGKSLITKEKEKYLVARLNLRAARKAGKSTAYESALKFLVAAIEFLPEEAWEVRYDLTFEVYLLKIECEYLCGNFEEAGLHFSQTLKFAKTNLDKARIYKLIILLYTNQGEYSQALEAGLECLSLFGMRFPVDNIRSSIRKEARLIDANQGSRPTLDLLYLEKTGNHTLTTIMDILMCMIAPTYFIRPNFSSMIYLSMVNFTLKFGTSSASAFGYMCYSVYLIQGNKLRNANEYAQMALKLNEATGAGLTAKLAHVYGAMLNPWIAHNKKSVEYLNTGFKTALETGELLFGGFIAMHLVVFNDTLGINLEESFKSSQKPLDYTVKARYEDGAFIIKLFRQSIRNLRGYTRDKYLISDENFDEREVAERYRERETRLGLFYYYFIKCRLLYLFDNPVASLHYAGKAKELENFAGGLYKTAELLFFQSLAMLAIYKEAADDERSVYKRTLQLNLKRLRQWSRGCPDNFQHLYLIVRAEEARRSGREQDAMRFYDEALDAAQNANYVQYVALASELAAEFYNERGHEKIARLYMQDARYSYEIWGASAKVRSLENKYHNLLPAYYERRRLKSNRGDEVRVTNQSNESQLDLRSVIKAYQAISGEIVLGKLLSNLMKIILENAGASRGALLLENKGEFKIEAIAEQNKVTVLKSLNYEEGRFLSPAIVTYVLRTSQSLVLSNAAEEERFIEDEYIHTHHPRSVLCAPIINQSKLTGIIYLENNLTTGVFTPDRLEIIQLLCSQAAVSLENARVHTTLYAYSRELERLGRVKDEFLSNLSHELKTPLTAIYANSELMRDDILDDPASKISMAREIHKNSEKLQGYINDLMLITTIEASPQLNKKFYNLSEMVSRILDLPNLLPFAGKMRIFREIPGNMEIPVDEIFFEKALGHVIKNALVYNRPNGQIHISAERHNEAINIRVNDDGIGIPPEKLDRIWEKFFRVDNSMTYEVSGVGLGLFLARRILELHDGNITAESGVEGSRFTLTIPAHL